MPTSYKMVQYSTVFTNLISKGMLQVVLLESASVEYFIRGFVEDMQWLTISRAKSNAELAAASPMTSTPY